MNTVQVVCQAKYSRSNLKLVIKFVQKTSKLQVLAGVRPYRRKNINDDHLNFLDFKTWSLAR